MTFVISQPFEEDGVNMIFITLVMRWTSSLDEETGKELMI